MLAHDDAELVVVEALYIIGGTTGVLLVLVSAANRAIRVITSRRLVNLVDTEWGGQTVRGRL